MKHFTLYSFLVITLSSCSGLFTSTPSLQSGDYVLNLKVDSILNPVRLSIYTDQGLAIEVKNDSEIIKAENCSIKDDSIFFKLPVFNSEFKGKIISDTIFEGSWFNYHKGEDYLIPFSASKQKYTSPSKHKISLGNWETVFSKGTEDESKAIGIFFLHDNNVLTGTFKTETGDYRFLEGKKTNTDFYLSCFDGSHAYYFTGTFQNDSTIINGTYRSGKHWSEAWEAKRNDSFLLADPYTLTFLNPGYDRITFSFPDLTNQQVSLDDEKFRNKAVIIQIMGTWCPNCLDESKYLKKLYDEKKESGLEIIALAYEAKPDFNYAKERVEKLKTTLDSKYTYLIAGTSNKEEASKTLPMLNKIMSFPTTIILDRAHNIKSIYTGFNGPSTGQAYLDYKRETETLIDSILKN